MHLGLPELVILFLIALLLFGPKRLPGLARQAGKALGEIKNATGDVRGQIQEEVEAVTKLKKDVIQTLNPLSTTAPASSEKSTTSQTS